MVWPPTRKATDSRTYINHIFIRSGKVPNWEPSCQIQLGDYGQIDRQTGLFVKEGNVFTDGKTRKASLLKTTTGPEVDVSKIFSLGITEEGVTKPVNSKGTKASLKTLNAFPGVRTFTSSTSPSTNDLVSETAAPASIVKSSFKFRRSKPGALMVMHKPVTSRLELEGLEQLLGSEDYEHLKEKLLVAEVVNCDAYAMYLSKGVETIGLSYKGNVPASESTDDSAASIKPVEGEGDWVLEDANGVFRSGSRIENASSTSEGEKEKLKYTTLFVPRIIAKRIVTARELYIPPMEEQMRDRWLLAYIPWNPLENNGDEEEDEPPRVLDENGCDW